MSHKRWRENGIVKEREKDNKTDRNSVSHRPLLLLTLTRVSGHRKEKHPVLAAVPCEVDPDVVVKEVSSSDLCGPIDVLPRHVDGQHAHLKSCL